MNPNITTIQIKKAKKNLDQSNLDREVKTLRNDLLWINLTHKNKVSKPSPKGASNKIKAVFLLTQDGILSKENPK